jgi:ligand-binding sensor domain-containing protein/putative methionine-R-sulfoxide reductase with GAF domain
MNRLLLFIGLQLLCYKAVYGQNFDALKQTNEANFTRFNFVNGLSNDHVTQIEQDDEGYMWIGTDNGINKFDGKTFTQYYVNDPVLPLPSSHISLIKNLSAHLLAIGTRKGLVVLNTQTYEHKTYMIADSTVFNGFLNGVWDVCLISPDRIAVTTASGFYVFARNGSITYRYDAYTVKDIDTKKIMYGKEIFSFRDHQYLVFVNGYGVGMYDADKNVYAEQTATHSVFAYPLEKENHRFKVKNAIGVGELMLINELGDSITYVDYKRKMITSAHLPSQLGNEVDWFAKLKPLNDSEYLLNSIAGFYMLHFNKRTGMMQMESNKILSTFSCVTYFIDKEKRLWAGAQNGLLMQQMYKKSITTVKNNTTAHTNLNGFNNTILAYKDKYYVGKYAKYDKGLQIINAQTLQIEKTIAFFNNKDEWNEILSIQQYYADTLWISTNMGILWFNVQNEQYGKLVWPDGDSILAKTKYPILYPPDVHGNAWILYEMQGLVARYTIQNRKIAYCTNKQSPQLPFKKIKSIAYDSYGNVWIAGHGLCRYNYATNQFDRYRNHYAGNNQYNDDIVCIMGDNSGRLWIQVADNELLQYVIKDESFVVVNPLVGMSIGEVESFSSVAKDKIWMQQLHKVVAYDLTKDKIQTFSGEDGLSADVNNKSSLFYFDTARNRLIALFNNELSFIDLQSDTVSNDIPALLIADINVDGKPYFFDGQQKIDFPYSIQRVSIHFTVIDFDNPNRYHFYYRINNKEWVSVKSERLIELNNLASGNYIITIKGIDKFGREFSKQLNIVVATPFWRAWWFVLPFLLLTVLGLFTLLRRRENALKRNAQVTLQRQQLETERLQAQLEMEQINSYFTSAVANKNTVDDVLWGVAKNLIGQLGFEDCMIYLWNESKTKMVQKAGYGPKGSIEEINKLPFDVVSGQGIVGHVMECKEAVIIPDTSLDARYRKDEMNRLSEICIPIIYEGELEGIIDSEHREKNFYTQRHLQIMTTIAALTINKIKSIESEAVLNQQKLEVANLNQRLAEFKMKALLAQMNPHFVFNSLGTINSMILNEQQEEASKYLSKFAKMIRLTLDHSNESFISLKQNNEYIRHYLEIENLRFSNVFSFVINIDSAIDENEIKIPPMMIQPLVENAIWHGLLKKDGDKKLIIRYAIMNEMLCCSIDDNGLGIHHT